jgi:hypothetical protein
MTGGDQLASAFASSVLSAFAATAAVRCAFCIPFAAVVELGFLSLDEKSVGIFDRVFHIFGRGEVDDVGQLPIERGNDAIFVSHLSLVVHKDVMPRSRDIPRDWGHTHRLTFWG